jgi:hypothetical protein
MLCGCILLINGCGAEKQSTEKIRDIEFTVLAPENIPEECITMIEDKKENPFQFSYEDGKYLYICVGYGKQETGGYSISVNELYLTKNAICVDTNLLGPAADTDKIASETYPYVVLKTEYLDENVVFD